MHRSKREREVAEGASGAPRRTGIELGRPQVCRFPSRDSATARYRSSGLAKGNKRGELGLFKGEVNLEEGLGLRPRSNGWGRRRVRAGLCPEEEDDPDR
jgi:hypothetical protein